MSKLPDFEGLALFAKVAEARSFAAAARELSLSVATVSRGVDRLEQHLGARVFNRSSRQLALTEFGRTLVEPASRLVRDAENAEGLARELSSQPRGLVRLAVPMSYGVRWVAPILPDFFRAYPEVAIDLHLADTTVDLVGDGFDAALRIAWLPDSSLVARRLCTVARYYVAAPAYIAAHGRAVHPRQLIASDCLSYAYRARSAAWQFRNGQGDEEVVVPEGRLRVNNSDAVLPMVLAGLGVAELPEFMVGEYLQDGRLQALLTDWVPQGAGLYFVTPTARARPTKVEVLAEFLASRLAMPSWRWL
jgi:DNA-binding transcriptional LysR family regulator